MTYQDQTETRERLLRPDSTPALRKRVLELAGPSLVEMALVTFVNMADMIMVGRLGPAAIAAVGLTNQPVFFAMAAFIALNVGTTAVIARAIGAGDDDVASDAMRQSLILVVIMGLAVSVLGFVFAGHVLEFMGAEPDVLPMGVSYMKIIASGGVFMVVSMSLTAALRGAGDTKSPMKANMVANVSNVIGNYLLIYGKFGFPKLGVAGAALATTIARSIAFFLLLKVVISGNSHLHLRGPFRLNRELLERIIRVGMPSAVEQIVLRGGQLVYVKIVAGFGTTVIAAHQIGMNIMNLSFMPGTAFAIAATTLVGQGLGAGMPDLAEDWARETRRMGTVVSCCMALLFILFGKYIAMLYTNDPEVIARTAVVLRILGLVQPAQSTQFILAGGLRGAGDTKWPLYSTAIGVWVFRVAVGYLLAVVMGMELVGAWMGMAVDQLARSTIIAFRFRSGKWKMAKV
ncbi:MAG TPA: MATE family efflux transporter [Bacillota bacterium]|nr:MATE family efflux transporter [Bacillota bacterium]